MSKIPYKLQQWLGDNNPQCSFDFGDEPEVEMIMMNWHEGDSESCLEHAKKIIGKRYNKDVWYKVIGTWKRDGDGWV